MTPGAGTALNVVTVLVGGSLGLLLGNRLPPRVRDVVTDGLGLVTLLVAALNVAAVTDPTLAAATGRGGPVLIVLGAVVLGGITGGLLRLEDRLEDLGGLLHRRVTRRRTGDGGSPSAERHRVVEGFVTASLVFCVGPLTVLGSLQDGLGLGIEQLTLKSTLDGFAALAFAAALGWGVLLSVFTIVGVQGSLTLAGVLLGDVLSAAQVASLTATGGVLLIGVGLRLLHIGSVRVADLLPALLYAPLLTVVAARLT